MWICRHGRTFGYEKGRQAPSGNYCCKINTLSKGVRYEYVGREEASEWSLLKGYGYSYLTR